MKLLHPLISRRIGWFAATLIGMCLVGGALCQSSKQKTEWIKPDDPELPIDYRLQGEYLGDKVGAQVIALGKNHFHAVILPGGLPGAGWDGTNKILLDGEVEEGKLTFEPAKGKRSYKAQNPHQFSATSKFPPTGHKEYTATLQGDTLTVKTDDGKTLELKKTVRKSPTMGAKPPEGAVILFDGKDASQWQGGRLDKVTGWLNTDRNDIRTKQKFNNYKMHVEFLLPFLPEARDQGRGNSGFYQLDRYEVQILDSFGLDGKNNECGGLYSKKDSDVNACFPPLTWQTYDVDFTNAVRDPDSGKLVKNARITVKLNGITIHDNVEIKGPSPGSGNQQEGTSGPIQFQGHGNMLQFRNVWLVEKP